MPADHEVQAHPSRYFDALRADVRAGLTATPKTLPPKYFYDARGSELFDRITRLPEYYPTRAERAILDAHPAVLKDASAAVAEAFPGLEVEPVVGDFERHLDRLPRYPRRLVAFLG